MHTCTHAHIHMHSCGSILLVFVYVYKDSITKTAQLSFLLSICYSWPIPRMSTERETWLWKSWWKGRRRTLSSRAVCGSWTQLTQLSSRYIPQKDLGLTEVQTVRPSCSFSKEQWRVVGTPKRWTNVHDGSSMIRVSYCLVFPGVQLCNILFWAIRYRQTCESTSMTNPNQVMDIDQADLEQLFEMQPGQNSSFSPREWAKTGGSIAYLIFKHL